MPEETERRFIITMFDYEGMQAVSITVHRILQSYLQNEELRTIRMRGLA